MPIYECSSPTCQKQYVCGTPRRRLYCTAHNALEPPKDGGLYVTDNATKKILLTMTDEQTADLREMLKSHGDPQLGLRPAPLPVIDLLPKTGLSPVSKEEFEEVICFLRAIDAVVKRDLELYNDNSLTMASVVTTARFMRSMSEDILKLLKEKV